MKWIKREELNEKLWNQWLDNKIGVQIFSSLEYLDETAEHLLFLCNDELTGGIALPHKTVLGVRTVYMPKFCRQLDWIGDQPPSRDDLLKLLRKEFHVGDVFLGDQILPPEAKVLIYQEKVDDSKYRTQSRRRLKEANKQSWSITQTDDVSEAIALIKSELLPAVTSLEENDFVRLRSLVMRLNEIGKLSILKLSDEHEAQGYLLIMKDKDRDIFLKGACKLEAKNAGGMYLLMDTAIQSALSTGKTFDFGGSRVPGVRRFNKSFGSDDQVYFRYSWNRAPSWYRLIQYFRKQWRKK